MKKLIVGVVALGFFLSAPVFSGERFGHEDIYLEYGRNVVSSNNDAQAIESEHLKLGLESIPLYFWVSQEDMEPQLFGQNMGRSDNFSYGIGLRHVWPSGWSAYVEAGITDVDFTGNVAVVEEMVYRELMKNHMYEGRENPIPIPPNAAWKVEPDARASYELSDFYVGRVGVGYTWHHIKINAAYRYGIGDEEMWMWSGLESRPDPSNPCQCAWMEDRSKDWGAFEIGIALEL